MSVLRGLLLTALFVAVLALALMVDAVWGYGLAGALAGVVLLVLATGGLWLEAGERRRQGG